MLNCHSHSDSDCFNIQTVDIKLNSRGSNPAPCTLLKTVKELGKQSVCPLFLSLPVRFSLLLPSLLDSLFDSVNVSPDRQAVWYSMKLPCSSKTTLISGCPCVSQANI